MAEIDQALRTKLHVLQQAGLLQVLTGQLAEMLGHSEADIQSSLKTIGVKTNDGSVSLRDLSFEQHVERDAYTQVGSHNQQFNVHGPLVQVPGSTAEHLRDLFPQPGEKARTALRQEGEAFIGFLQTLPELSLHGPEAAIAWYEMVEGRCRPLATALVVAVKQIPPEIVSAELKGLLTEAIKVLRLRIDGHVDYSLGWRAYPLLILATAVLVAVLDSRRWDVLPALVSPTISAGNKQIRWLYLTGYADGLTDRGFYPTRSHSQTGALAIEERVTDLLIGEQGWLKEELPVYGNEQLLRQAHAVLAFLTFDAERRYFGKQSQEFARLGRYLWDSKTALEGIAEFSRGVANLGEANKVLVDGGTLLSSDFGNLMSQPRNLY
ncbi:hypothetical protein [Deinococcus radiophilus]|uniref:Uncharacterized protein n=1 Tax=Deinococcus radiophilus TaxID=32062 RepID=A0A431VL24_9DEIO|nr:hypothetical protein [Deinococcus radiophilus]RTR21869.1 hypothetical protein EJ104_12930 [Deinococcus radiophilus]UFA52032.1 hypothetical protein LMT64_13670 [Deinococcus radiophilus]